MSNYRPVAPGIYQISSGKYYARRRIGGVLKRFGPFSTQEEAEAAWTAAAPFRSDIPTDQELKSLHRLLDCLAERTKHPRVVVEIDSYGRRCTYSATPEGKTVRLILEWER